MNLNIMPHGWMAKGTLARPKARVCGFLAVIWIGVAFIAATILLSGDIVADDPQLKYLAWLIEAPEPVFIGLAVFFRFTERPQMIRNYSRFDLPIH